MPKHKHIVPFVSSVDIQDSCMELDDTGYEEDSHPSKVDTKITIGTYLWAIKPHSRCSFSTIGRFWIAYR